MATQTIPFPTKEILLGPEIARAASPPKTCAKSATKKSFLGPKKSFTQPKAGSGVGKPKQTKSRNGCATCKEKRLKCDETKPHCEQCKRRNVECGGYNKIFQWRPEEKATFRANPTTKPKKRSAPVVDPHPPPSSPVISDLSDVPPIEEPKAGESGSSTVNTFPLDPQIDQSGYAQATSQLNFHPDNITPGPYEITNAADDGEKTHGAKENVDNETVNSQLEPSPLSVGTVSFPLEEDTSIDGLACLSSGLSAPDDWLDLSHHPVHEIRLPSTEIYNDDGQMEIEEAMHQEGRAQLWFMKYPSPSPTDSCSSTPDSRNDFSIRLKDPMLSADSPEMLLSMFSQRTCGILSIKDGPSENPWRTILLPMAADIPALRHAILALTAFHASRQDPRYRIAGLRHSQKSIQYLSNRLNIMQIDAALATTLVLAFSESWDQETSTGIRHLQAARKLVTQAIANHQQSIAFKETDRLKFLRNTWVYMDVIARITAVDEEDLEHLNHLFAPLYESENPLQELDPLMGCATSLFPLLGRVANLVREIQRASRTSPRIVSRAAGLRTEILKWRAPSHVRQPEDESIEIAHSIKTAEAYRWATLLFLYQAVPMIATENLGDLAERALYNLASVPTSSRLIIVHIFPLLIAGCELSWDDNRLLVEERWSSMTQRMSTGNLDRCLDIIHEVWTRRDRLAFSPRQGDDQAVFSDEDVIDNLPNLSNKRRAISTPSSYPLVIRPDQLRRTSTDHVAEIEPETTIHGKCHWLTVMRDWDWAVLLG